MGTTVSSQAVTQINQIIYDVMIENQLGCDQNVIANQSLCASGGVIIGSYQQQIVKGQINCQQSQSYNSKIQQDLKEKLQQYANANSKMFVPATTVTDLDTYIENVVDIHFTNENIMAISNSIVASQAIDLNCSGNGQGVVAVGIYQNQNVGAKLTAIQDVMSKTTFYQDMLGDYNTSTESAGTFLSGFMFFLVVIVIIVAMVLALKALLSPEGQKIAMAAV